MDAVVQIGSAYWLRVPVGKLHTDRYIPLDPQLTTFIDDWLAQRPDGLRSELLFVERGRRFSIARVDRAVAKVAKAGVIVGHVAPHQLRHTGFWNTCRFTFLIPVSAVRLLRVRHHEKVLLREWQRAHATGPEAGRMDIRVRPLRRHDR